MKYLQTVLVSIFLFTAAGCGYTTGSLLPPRFKSIHVELFENTVDYTAEKRRGLYVPLMEVRAREAITDRFLFDGNLRTAEEGLGDLVLSGKLRNFERHELRISDNENVEEYRLEITVAITLYDVQREEIMWSEPYFAGETTYFATGPLAISEAAAVEAALEDLARRIVERTIEDW